MSLERARSLPPFVSSVADQQADHHEERPQWQTDSTQEDPEVQSKAGSSSRVLRREIPDSQESFQAEDSGDLEDRLDSHDREVPQSQSLDLLSDNLPHSCRNHQSGRIFGGEIPDSQETQLDNDEEASFHSERTEIIPGGFELRQRGAPEVQDPTTPVWVSFPIISLILCNTSMCMATSSLNLGNFLIPACFPSLPHRIAMMLISP